MNTCERVYVLVSASRCTHTVHTVPQSRFYSVGTLLLLEVIISKWIDIFKDYMLQELLPFVTLD